MTTKDQEPVAWRTFDGEGGYDYRSYEDNETYQDEWLQRNPNHKGWVEPLFAHPAPDIVAEKDAAIYGIGITQDGKQVARKDFYIKQPALVAGDSKSVIADKDAELEELRAKLEKCKRVAREYTADNADFELLLLDLDQQGSYSNPAPVHGQSKTGLTSSQLDAPTLAANKDTLEWQQAAENEIAELKRLQALLIDGCQAKIAAAYRAAYDVLVREVECLREYGDEFDAEYVKKLAEEILTLTNDDAEAKLRELVWKTVERMSVELTGAYVGDFEAIVDEVLK